MGSPIEGIAVITETNPILKRLYDIKMSHNFAEKRGAHMTDGLVGI